jgi:GAF domain-containing protein
MTIELSNAIILKVAELSRSIQENQYSDGISKPLGELIATAAKSVPGAQHAAITIVGRDGVQTVVATARYPMVLGKFRQHHDAGPCDAATWTHEVIRIDDVSVEQRWRGYCRDIAGESPIRSILSFRLFVEHHSMGLLTFYSDQPHAFDNESMEIGLVMATHTALAWNTLRRDEQFRSALASRDVIGQAKGMIMERFQMDAVQAFQLLSRLSQNSNTPVVEIAYQIVNRQQAR